MEPELQQGEQVFVQHFRYHGADYMSQRFALRYRGRTVVRRVTFGITDSSGTLVSGGYHLFGNRDGWGCRQPGAIDLPWPDGWKPAADWMTTGVIHPECTAIGPVLCGYRHIREAPYQKYVPVTAGWSN